MISQAALLRTVSRKAAAPTPQRMGIPSSDKTCVTSAIAGAEPEPVACLPLRVAEPPEPLERSLQALDIPPPNPPLAVRVDHFTVPRDGPVLEVLAELLGYPQPFVERLISFGSVWYSHVLPKPKDMAALSQAQVKEWERSRQPGLLKWGKGTEAQTPRRVKSPSMLLHEGGYIRAHVHPKRFEAVHRVPDWRARVLIIADDYVVVDKPPGVQVPPTVGNIQESLLACVEKALGYEAGALSPPHRLDAGTQGCVVLSKTPAFSRYFQELMRDKEGQAEQPSPAGRRQQQQQQQQQSRQEQHQIQVMYAPQHSEHPPQQHAVPGTAQPAQQTPDVNEQPQHTPGANVQPQSTPDVNVQLQHTPDVNVQPQHTPDVNVQLQHTPDVNVQPRQLQEASASQQHATPGAAQPQQLLGVRAQQHAVTDLPLQPELPSAFPSRVRKSYRCITAAPPPLGLVTHWVLQGVREVGCMAHTLPLSDGQQPPEDAKWCALEVMQVEKVKLSTEACASWRVDAGASAYQSTVRLITGRTHQIRAQFAALNCPLLGDKLYEALALRWSFQSQDPMLSSKEMIYLEDGKDRETAQQDDSSQQKVLWDPAQPLGLQAWQMEILEDSPYFGPAPTVFQAGPPWWWADSDT